MTRVVASLLVLLAAAVLALPQASSAQVPDERVAAREFSYAAYRLRVKIKAAMPAMNQAAGALSSPACSDASSETPKLTKAAERKAGVLLAEVLFGAILAPVADDFGTFQTELDRVPTSDAALAAGRESWRSTVVLLQQVQPVPADVCSRIRAWVDSGYADAALPVLQPAPLHELIASAPESDEPDTAPPGVRRAAARMRELGVPKGQAQRFAGATLFRGVDVLGFGSVELGT
jgi:hypothetical protein